MGRISKGVLGGFSGKVGNVIGGNWKGIDYMRVKPSKVKNPRTEGQVNQRSKFATVLQFLQPMKDFLKVGFKAFAIKQSEFNSAMSYNLKNAVVGEYPNPSIDYANVRLSRGALTGAMNALFEATPGEVVFNWSDNSGQGSAKATDVALLMIYNETKGEAIFTTYGEVREAGTQTLPIPDDYLGDNLHFFISFISSDGKEVSNSSYIGSAVV